MSTVDLKLPDIGEGVTEGEMVSWLVGEGDQVEADQPVAEIMTDKATVEVPAPDAGTISKLIAKEGDTIPVGQVMLTMEVGAASSSSSKEDSKKEESKSSKENKSEDTQEKKEASASDSKKEESGSKQNADVEPPVADSSVLASPSTRRLAREMNVDINKIEGTGLAGRVTREDLEGHGSEQSSSKSSGDSSSSSQTFKMPARSFESKEDAMLQKRFLENYLNYLKISPHAVDHGFVNPEFRFGTAWLRSQNKDFFE